MITRDLLMKYCPHAQPEYLDSFEKSKAWLERTGTATTPLRAAHFLTQAISASRFLFFQSESLWFTAREISERWPRLFPSASDALSIAGKEKDLAEAIYGGRIGNGENNGDAWKYRARGIFRIVGKNNYAAISRMIGADLVEKPDLVFGPDFAVACAVTIYNLRSAPTPAERDDVQMVTTRMGGRIDEVPERRELLLKLKADLGA